MSQTTDLNAKVGKGWLHIHEHAPPSYSAHASSPFPSRDCGQAGGPSSSLSRLPVGISDNIIKFLDPASRRCLFLTNRRFRSMSYGGEEELSRCGKWLVMALLEQDLADRFLADCKTSVRRRSILPVVLSMKKRLPLTKRSNAIPEDLRKLTCSLCKIKHGPDSFLTGGPRMAVLHAKHDRNILAQRSLERICTWHYGKVVRTELKVTPTTSVFYDRWVSTIKDMCTHCGQIEQYGQCCCNSPKFLDGETIPAVCNICPKVKIRVYERIGMEGDNQKITHVFKMDKDGTVYVLEERTKPGNCMCSI